MMRQLQPKERHMRLIVLATALIILAPATFAQTTTPGTAGQGRMGGTNAPPMASSSGASSSGTMTSQATNPNNCGTPDEPKPCPPMPRRPLQHYPANKQ
jgi:hypothetical protein